MGPHLQLTEAWELAELLSTREISLSVDIETELKTDVEKLESELERTASEILRSAAQLESKAEDIYDQALELEDA